MPWFIVVQSCHPRFWFLWILNCYPIKKQFEIQLITKRKRCNNFTMDNYGIRMFRPCQLFTVKFLHFFQVCDIRPGCHHHFDASGTSNAMFDELAERSLMSPLARTKHTYVRLTIIIHCKITKRSEIKLTFGVTLTPLLSLMASRWLENVVYFRFLL